MDKNEPYELFLEIVSHLKTYCLFDKEARIAALTVRCNTALVISQWSSFHFPHK